MMLGFFQILIITKFFSSLKFLVFPWERVKCLVGETMACKSWLATCIVIAPNTGLPASKRSACTPQLFFDNI